MKRYRLPEFSLDKYADLLNRLIGVGYQFQKVNQMCDFPQGKVAYLRHDVDLHISLISEMALTEKNFGISATYFVPLTLHFNLFYPTNQNILRQLVEMGHEIGLHYDMETYPLDPEEARRHLDWEVGVLAKVIEQPVHSISMHNPCKGQPDPFREIDEYVHPHDPRYQDNLLYVSDSCRAWCDASLLTCFGPNPPRKLLLNVHPELWLDGSVDDRIQYLDRVLTKNATRQHLDYFGNYVRNIWLTHPATKKHEDRQVNTKAPS